METEFGKLLKLIRSKTGDSLRTMANKLDISASYLSAIENGKRKIPIDLVNEISKKYNLNLIEGKKIKEIAINSNDKLEINVKDLSDEKKKLILTISNEKIDEELVTRLCEMIDKNKKGE